MPEGLEIRFCAQRLDRLFLGFVLRSLEILEGPYLENNTRTAYQIFRDAVCSFNKGGGHRIREVSSKGKWLYFRFEDQITPPPSHNFAALGVHHGMVGGWSLDWSLDCFLDDEEAVPTHAVLKFDLVRKGFESLPRTIFFHDAQKYGTFKLMTLSEFDDELGKLGPDVCDVDMTANPAVISPMGLDAFIERFSAPPVQKRYKAWMICDVLLEQSVVSGIGNYLRADILYDAGIDPRILLVDLSRTALIQLYVSTFRIVQENWKAENLDDAIYGPRDCVVYNKTECPKGYPVETFQSKNKRTMYYVPDMQITY